MVFDWTLQQIIIAALVVFQLVCLFYIAGLKSTIGKLQQTVNRLSEEQQAMLSGSVGLGRKLFEVATNLNHLEQSQADLQQSTPNDKAIEQAAKMLQKGLSVEDVIDSCQISRGEAELLRDMMSANAIH